MALIQTDFRLGKLVMSRGVAHELSPEEFLPFVTRHARGDWGNISMSDCALNNTAVRDGTRILSSYTTSSGRQVWIITEADRSATTVLFPEEY